MYNQLAIYKEAKSYLDADNIPSTESAETEEGYSYFWYKDISSKQNANSVSGVRIGKIKKVIETNAYIDFKKGDYVDFRNGTILEVIETTFKPNNKIKRYRSINMQKLNAIWTLTLE